MSSMNTAAIGVSVHSGWGAVVAMAGNRGMEEIFHRSRVVITDSKFAGTVQPYHYIAKKELREAETHLARCSADSRRLSLEALTRVADDLRERGFVLISAAILLSSARPLPALEEILASHALIHTAEGEFFRQTFRSAFEHLKIPVTGIRARDLNDVAVKAFGKAAPAIQKRINSMGRSLGAPWTQDEKTAALAAMIVLAGAHLKTHAAHSSGA